MKNADFKVCQTNFMHINLCSLQLFILCGVLHFLGALSRKCFHCNAGSDSENLDCWDGKKLLVYLFILLYM